MTNQPSFDALVAAARTRHVPERVFNPGVYPPVRAGGRACFSPAELYAAYEPGPQHVAHGRVWQEIGGFVRECVAKAPCESPATARTRMSYTAAFVAWCMDQDVPLRVEMVFTPERVEAYAMGALRDRPQRSVAVIRSGLRTVGLACTRKAAWSRPPTKLRQNAYLCAPYTHAELTAFWAAADAQATPRRRHIMRLILSLGLGAGLSSAEMFELHAHDVLTLPEDERVRVIVLPDRVVPLRAELTPVLDELCQAVPRGRLVGGRASEAMMLKDPLATYRRDLDLPSSLPALTLSRLRTTWAVSVLSVPVTISEFLTMAGTTSAKSLELYIEHVPARQTPIWMGAATGL